MQINRVPSNIMFDPHIKQNLRLVIYFFNNSFFIYNRNLSGYFYGCFMHT